MIQPLVNAFTSYASTRYPDLHSGQKNPFFSNLHIILRKKAYSNDPKRWNYKQKQWDEGFPGPSIFNFLLVCHISHVLLKIKETLQRVINS